MKRQLIQKLFFTFALGALVFATPVFAQNVGGVDVNTFSQQSGLGVQNPKVIISNIINVALGFLSILAVLLILYGGFRYMTANGVEENVQKARKTITQAVVGLVIILSSWAITVFLLNAIGGATGAIEGGTTGGTTSGGLGGGGTTRQFLVTGFSPSGTLPIRPSEIDISFNSPINATTLTGNVTVTAGGIAVPGTLSAVGSTVSFVPESTCPAPNEAHKCLAADSEFTITVSTNLKSEAGLNLNCGALSAPCVGTFKSGNQVDFDPPTGRFLQPLDGSSFNIDTGFLMKVEALDNVATSRVEFTVDGASAGSATVSQTLAQLNYTQTVTAKTILTLGGKIFDFGSNQAPILNNPKIIGRAAHCFNAVKDLDETGLNCGGADCGVCAGGACIVNTDCASGVCQGGVCVERPVISDVQPRNGAPGNFVTITGDNFSPHGTVVFLGGAADDDDKIASLACSGAWSDKSVIVQIPEGAIDGPIKIVNDLNLSDSTATDGRGVELNFDINDIKRPGLCSAQPNSGAIGQSLTFNGGGLGAEASAKIGNVSTTVQNASSTAFDSSIPALEDGQHDAVVSVATIPSNPLPITVKAPEPEPAPTIGDISPTPAGPGSTITITGTNFGITGTVRFISGDKIALGDTDFPAQCGTSFWSPNSIRVKIPKQFSDKSTVAPGTYSIVVERTSGTRGLSAAQDYVVNSDPAGPGLCAMDPVAGPENIAIKLFGEGFGASAGVVNFGELKTENADTVWTDGDIQTKVPAGAKSAMVKVSSAARVTSNGIFFTVGNCKAGSLSCPTGTQCCDNGSCSATCSVKVTDAAYAWRFSTGRLPRPPKLMAQCGKYPDPDNNMMMPSPSPLIDRAGGNQVCPNAKVTAVFDTFLSQGSIQPNTLQVFCDDANNTVCGSDRIVPGTFSVFSADPKNTDTTLKNALDFIPTGGWKPGKYHVEVKSTLSSTTTDSYLAAPAAPNPTCDRAGATDIAFCWRFEAGTQDCKVASYAVLPSSPLIDEPYDNNRPLAKPDGSAIQIEATPLADDALCLALSTAGLNFTWTSADINKVKVQGTSQTLSKAFALLGGDKETGEAPIKVKVSSEGAEGFSMVGVRFGRPTVVRREPDCEGACVNAAIRAVFSTHMKQSTVQMKLWRCANSTCNETTRVGDEIPLPLTFSTETINPNQDIITASPALDKNSYYRVLIPARSGVSDCLACSTAGISLAENGVNYRLPKVGGGEDLFYSWVFKTKPDGTPCEINIVNIEPAEAKVDRFGAVAAYLAMPRSAPDECNKDGQALNPNLSNWNWSLTPATGIGEFFNSIGAGTKKSSSVAQVNQVNTHVSGVTAGYTSSCLRSGSDATFGGTASCGNGAWEKSLGEGCDDGNVVNGDGCSDHCVPEGFTTRNVTWNRSSVAGNCGDGRVQNSELVGSGEQCDDGNTTNTDQCNDKCLWTGVSLGTCGNGKLEPGEACDDGNTNSGDGCSNRCLYEGSVSGVTLCGDGLINPVKEDCDKVGLGAVNWPNGVCNPQTCLWRGTSAPICGNNVQDPGEQCEDGNVVNGDGCSERCLLEGANARYQPTPSFCGDGVVGPGEASGSEATGVVRNLVDPDQFVRATTSQSANASIETYPTQTKRVTGTAAFKVVTNVCDACVIDVAPTCASGNGVTACETAGGACQNSVSGMLCSVPNVTTAEACAAKRGRCIVQSPELLVRCGSNGQPNASLPSPAPLVDQADALNVQDGMCKNALITGAFNQSMDAASVRAGVEVYDCGASAIDADCTRATRVTISPLNFIVDSDGALTNSRFLIYPTSSWTADHVYVVAVRTTVKGVSGKNALPGKTFGRDCGPVNDNIHTCWRFKTTDLECPPNRISVAVSPSLVTQQAQSVIAQANVLAERCVAINERGILFAWNALKFGATPEAAADNVAFNPTNPTGSTSTISTLRDGKANIRASISQTPLVKGEQTLTVQLAPEDCPAGQGTGNDGLCHPRPEVDWTLGRTSPVNNQGASESSCKGVARNASIRVKFNQVMDASTLLIPGAITVNAEGNCASAPESLMKRMVNGVKNLLSSLKTKEVLASHTAAQPDALSYCSVPIAGSVHVLRDNDQATGLVFDSAAPMQALKWYRVSLSGAIRSEEGVSLVAASDNYNYYFHTAQTLAPVTEIKICDSIDPDCTGTSSVGLVDTITDPAKPQREFLAFATGQICNTEEAFQLAPKPGIYEWVWQVSGASAWSPESGAQNVQVVVDQATTESENPSRGLVKSAVKDSPLSRGVIAASASISVNNLSDTDFSDIQGRAIAIGSTKTGTKLVTIMPCRNPWPATGASPWSDTSSNFSSGYPKTNFSFFYCRDGQDGSLMPGLKAVPGRPQGEIVKEFLFEQPTGLQSKIPGLAKKLAYANTGSALSMVDVGSGGIQSAKQTVSIPKITSKLALLGFFAISPSTANTGSAYNITSISGIGFTRGWDSETNLVGYWPLDSVTSRGVTQNIVSGDKANVIKAQSALGVIGTSLSTMNPATGLYEGYVSAPNTGGLNISGTQITVAAWVNRSSAAFVPWETIVSKGSSSYRLHLCGLGSSCPPNKVPNSFTFGLIGGTDVDSGVVPIANRNYFVVGVYDGVNQSIYVDGALRGTQARTGGIPVNTSTFDFGQNSVNLSRNWRGTIDEVRLYNKALTAAEINELYLARRNGSLVFTSASNQKITCTGTSFTSATLLSGGTCSFATTKPGLMSLTLTGPDGASMVFTNAVKLNDTTAPSTPVLSGVANGIFSAMMSWTASTDNDAVASYVLQRCHGAGCASFTSVMTGTSLSISDAIAAGNTYSYRVKATDAAGNSSAYSNVVTVVIPALDDTPDPIVFNPATNVAKATVIVSNAVTITGVNAPVPISVTSGEYRINNGAWTSVGGTINGNDTVDLRHTSSSTDGGVVTTTLTVGILSATFTSSVIIPIDTVPDAFTLAAITNAPVSTAIVSAPITITGINSPSPASISNGASYRINSGIWMTAASKVNNNDKVEVQLNSSAAFSTMTQATLTIGGVTGNFQVTTVALDTIPDPFTFAAVTGAPLNTVQTSQSITISGINSTAMVSVTGGEYSLSGSNLWFPAGRPNGIANGKTLLVRHTSSANYSTAVTTTLTVGSVSASFISTTIPEPPDTTPDPFSFTDVTGVALSTSVQPVAFTVKGINVPTEISIVGGAYSVNGASFSSLPGKVKPNDQIIVKHTSASTFATLTTTTLTIGGVAGQLKSTTIPEPVDNAKPVMSIQSPAPASVVKGSVLIVVGVRDESSAVSVTATVPCGTITPTSVLVPTTPTTDSLANLTWNLEAGTKCAAGNTTVTIKATDTAKTPNILEQSLGVIVELVDRTVPSITAGLKQGQTSATEVTLSWDPATDNVGVSGYVVERCLGKTCTSFSLVARTNTTAYVDRGLTPATEYRYRITAVDASQNSGGVSLPLSVRTAASRAVVVITWLASKDNVGVDHYEVERCQGVGCSNFIMIGKVNGLSYSDYDVQPQSTYGYRVIAADAALNRSTPSKVITVLVPAIVALNNPQLLPTVPERVAQLFRPPNIRVRRVANDTEPPTAPGEPAILPSALKPEIVSLSPAGQPRGGQDFTLTVQGVNFADRSAVLMDAEVMKTKYISSTLLEAMVPAKILSDIRIIAVTVFTSEPGGGTSSSATFKVGRPTNPVPGFTALSPSDISKLQSATLTISGGGFSDGITSLRFGAGIIVRKFKVINPETVEAEVYVTPLAAEGPRDVSVINLAPGGGTASLSEALTVENPAPILDSVSPTQVLSGSPSAKVTLRGKNFVNSTKVEINGVSTQPVVISDTEAQLTLDQALIASEGELSLVVSNGEPGGGLSTAKKVTVGPNPKPTLQAISPNRVIAGPDGFMVSLSGSGFAETSIVAWGTKDLTPIFINESELMVKIAKGEAATAGTVQVKVKNPAPGGGDSELVNFLIKPFVPGDVVGVRILQNPKRLSAIEWYKSKGYPGNPVAMTIDGYDAVLDGRTLYVNATNFGVQNGSIAYTPGINDIYSNIYVISYNLDAGPEMKLIHASIMKSLEFNENLVRSSANDGFCRASSALNSEYLFKEGKLVSCSSDLDCSSIKAPAICASEKAKFQRDQKRLNDYYGLVSKVVSKANGGAVAVPQIESGSFLKSFSTSAWPSWQKTLGVTVSGVPVDPLNKFTTCRKICSSTISDPTPRACRTYQDCVSENTNYGACISDINFDQTTCWDEETVKFTCPAGSQVYTYQSLGRSTANFSLEFETQAMKSFRIGICEMTSSVPGKRCELIGLNDPACGANFKCLDTRGVTSTAPIKLFANSVCSAGISFGATSVCGDGVVGKLANGNPETCEKGQAGLPVPCGDGTGHQPTVCNNTCTGFDPVGQCELPSCGNGKVDPGEFCDDGVDNGRYGFCNVSCLGRGTFCGDASLQPGEECDCGVPGAPGAIPSSCGNKRNGEYNSTCSVECKKPGPKCGDQVLNSPIEKCELGEVRTSGGGKVCSNDIAKACTDNAQCTGGTCLAACGLSADGRVQTRRQQCAQNCSSWNAPECVSGKCGDGITATDKVCSNSNTSCTKDADCGGGACLPVEQCDDGNKSDNDVCTTQCKLNYCGDGFTNSGIEECDDGDRNGSECDPSYGGVCNYCSSSCKVRTVSGAICGNGTKEKGELCDGKDFGGKYCLGGLDEGRGCASDTECTGNGKCVAQYCVGGMKCELFKEVTSWPATEANPFDPSKKVKDFTIRNLDLENNSWGARGYCSKNELTRCWNNAGGNNSICESGQTCVETIAGGYFDAGKLFAPVNPDIQDYAFRCNGYVRPKYTGTYTFSTVSDDGLRFYLDGQLLINSWAEQSAQVVRPTSLTLEANRWYPIRIEHYEHGGAQLVRVAWKNTAETGDAYRVIGGNSLSSLPTGSVSALECPKIGICNGASSSAVGRGCGSDAECGIGGSCVEAGVCSGGTQAGNSCNPNGTNTCRGGICKANGMSCVSGSLPHPAIGKWCQGDNECSGGTCEFGNGIVTNAMKGICLGGSGTDGAECTSNSNCGAGGVCSFVPGKCLENGTISSISCVANTDCNSRQCARGVCNGGADNGKACVTSSSCATGGTCTFSRCEQACGASCPTNNQSTSLQFRVIGTGSKCTGGDLKRAGGGCSKEDDCYGSCGIGIQCTADTTCTNGKCVPTSATCSSGFKLPSGTCALCAPTATPAASVSLGGAIGTDYPKNAWLIIPACRALTGISTNLDKDTTIKIGTGTDRSSNNVTYGFDKALNSLSFIKCSEAGETIMPLEIENGGTGKSTISNLRASYCPVGR